MNPFKIVGFIFALIGIASLIGVGFSLSNTRKFIANSITTTGEVVGIVNSTTKDSDGNQSNSRYKVVRFTDSDGYTVEFQSSSSTQGGIRIGEPIEVRYEKGNSTRARIASSFMDMWGTAVIFLILGVVFAGIGIPFVWFGMRDTMNEKWARNNGREIQAEVVAVMRNTSLSVNGRHPWQVTAQWQDSQTGEVHIFKSKNLWYDPTPYLTEKVFVKFDPLKPKRYWVNLAFLPAKAV